MPAARLGFINKQRDDAHGPPSRVTILDSDGLLADIPISITSTLPSRALPDFGRFVYERAVNEANDLAGWMQFERVVQDVCPDSAEIDSGKLFTIQETDGLIADIPSTVSSSIGGVTARGLPDFGKYIKSVVMQEVCPGCPPLGSPQSPSQPGPCGSIPALGVP